MLTSDGRDDEREMRRVKRTCMARAPRGRSPQGREVGPRVCRLGPRVYRTDTRSHLSLRAARSPRARRDTGPAVSLSAQGVEAVTTTRPATADTCSRRARPRRLLAARSGLGSVHPPPHSSALSPFPRGSSCKEHEARRPGSRCVRTRYRGANIGGRRPTLLASSRFPKGPGGARRGVLSPRIRPVSPPCFLPEAVN